MPNGAAMVTLSMAPSSQVETASKLQNAAHMPACAAVSPPARMWAYVEPGQRRRRRRRHPKSRIGHGAGHHWTMHGPLGPPARARCVTMPLDGAMMNVVSYACACHTRDCTATICTAKMVRGHNVGVTKDMLIYGDETKSTSTSQLTAYIEYRTMMPRNLECNQQQRGCLPRNTETQPNLTQKRLRQSKSKQ